MKINVDYSDKLYRALKNRSVCIDRRRYDGFIITRCPFCGDSIKNRNKGHLYIKVVIAEGEVSWYKCHKCGTKGLTDSYLFGLLSIYDDELEFLRKVNDTVASKQYGKLGLRDNKIKPIKILPPLNNAFTKAKIKYINKRIGISLTQKDIEKFKLVFNLRDFLDYNNIKNITRDNKIITNLDESYVGFLSAKSEFINFRIIDDNLIDKYNQRYENYNIFDLHDNTRRFITIKDKIDIMKNITIKTCEGPFDLMGIYKNVCDEESKNTIYVANMGMSPESVMFYYIRKGVIFNKLQIYADKGVSLDYYRDLKQNKLGYKYKGNIEVFYNDFKDKKDFGVPKEEIKLKSFII
jgi:hypothetical protein